MPTKQPTREFVLEVIIRMSPDELRVIANLLEEPDICQVKHNSFNCRYSFVNKDKPKPTSPPPPKFINGQ